MKENNAPAHRGKILLQTGDDSSCLTPIKAPACCAAANGIHSEEAILHREITLLRMSSLKAASFGRSESPRVFPLPWANFLLPGVNERRIALHWPSLSRGRGGRGNKMIAKANMEQRDQSGSGSAAGLTSHPRLFERTCDKTHSFSLNVAFFVGTWLTYALGQIAEFEEKFVLQDRRRQCHN